MANYAEIDGNNIVQRVIVVETSPTGEAFLAKIGGTWIQTSYNTSAGIHRLGGTPLRKNYAGIGYQYDPALDAFIPPKPFPSWLLNESTCQWDPPIPCPSEPSVWNEASLSWVLL